MLVDLIIVAFAISALYRGREIGFVRQLFSTLGFFGGLFLGAWLEKYTVNLAHTASGRALVTLLTTLGCALILLTIGEYFGLHLKRKALTKHINNYDVGFGALLGMASLLVSAWLIASVISSFQFIGFQNAIQNSRIISALNHILPAAPTVIADLGHLIDPNGFPQVFIGSEPAPRSSINLPSLGDLRNAVSQDRDSVVKIEGQGCGGVVEGSGFVVGSDLVATNAHVIAGIKHPFAIDNNGTHRATVLWFDPNLDFAVLRVSNLAGKPLVISHQHVPVDTAAAVLGYPGGGPLSANAAAILDQFTATGRNIYGRGSTDRAVYELQADVIPGNSGGPLIAKDGSVIGVIFAESTTYEHVGYALTTGQVSLEINQAAASNQAVSTGQCAD